MKTTPPELVIFDCDGVLVDSERPMQEAIADNLARYGLTLTVEECEARFVGTSIENIRNWSEANGAVLPPNWGNELHREAYDRLRKGVEVVDGIPELIKLLMERKIAFCVASNGAREKMEITLGQNNLWQYFKDRCFSAYEIGISKPDPGLFLTAARAFEARPENCIVIEDSSSGIRAAIAAGMTCHAYCPHGPNATFAELGANLFSDMRRMPQILELV